jgi:ribosomal protein L1
MASKITASGVRQNVQEVLRCTQEKKRNFKETIELQIGLKVSAGE